MNDDLEPLSTDPNETRRLTPRVSLRETRFSLADIEPFLSYDATTGGLFWKTRYAGTRYGSGVVTDVTARAFNTRCAGRRAERYSDRGYARVRLFGEDFMGHRLAWLLHYRYWPAKMLDHINGVLSDNRICNLRQVLAVDNCRNRKLRYDNMSGVTGVSWSATKGVWVARIGVKGKDVHLGCYQVFDDAVSARKSAEKRYGFHPNHGRSE